MKNSKHLSPIGGEFWFELRLFNKEPQSLEKYIMLSGGQCSINFILEDINFKNDEYVLLPAYICPSILLWFDRKGINYSFYKIKKDLSIDIEDLELCLSKYKTKALFFINYFGFYHSKEVINFLRQLKKKEIILIEDAVQMFWTKANDKFIGNYVFNSFRKFIPIDGSLLICREYEPYKTSEMDNYLKLSYKARMLKTLYQSFGIGEEEEFLHCFELAETEYYNRENIEFLDAKSEELIKKLDVEFIENKRKSNYKYLFNKLRASEIEPMFKLDDESQSIPLGLPILIDNRDVIRKELRKNGIYCPVHWDIRKEHWISEFQESFYVADKILTLPIDQRYEFKDMDRIFDELMRLYNYEKCYKR